MKKALFLLLILSIFSFTLHNYHLSLTKIVFKEKSNTLQITMRYYIDDIELEINNLYKIEAELNTDRELPKIDKILKKHILNNFNILVNQTVLPLSFIGKEYEKDLIYFYFESNQIDSIKNIEVNNNVLFKTFNDQQNIVKLAINDVKKTFYLNSLKDKEMLKFDK